MTKYYIKYLTGRCRTASDGKGVHYHALERDSEWDDALCGRKPGAKSNGWNYPAVESEVTCEKCLKKIAKESQ